MRREGCRFLVCADSTWVGSTVASLGNGEERNGREGEVGGARCEESPRIEKT